jgi:hypothetical protein
LWGLKRIGDRIRTAGEQAAKMAQRRGLVELRGKFIWLPDQELTEVRSPCWSDDRTFRAIDEIPPEEIDLAFERLMASGILGDAELIPVAAKVLGFDRAGGRIRQVLEPRLRKVRTRTNG